MNPTTPISDTDYKQLFGALIKKQMLVLGPDITLAKVRNVVGLTVDINGEVQKIDGDPQVLLQSLINQFVELSGMIVKKTMESILTSYPGMMAMAATGAFGGGVEVSTQTQPQMATHQAISQPSGESIQVSPQPEITAPSETSSSIEPPVSESATFEKPAEPPPMTDMKLDSLSTSPVKENKEASFTDDDMEKLNKALDDLSKAPLSVDQAPVK